MRVKFVGISQGQSLRYPQKILCEFLGLGDTLIVRVGPGVPHSSSARTRPGYPQSVGSPNYGLPLSLSVLRFEAEE